MLFFLILWGCNVAIIQKTNKPLKVNFSTDGKLTSTTLNYRICFHWASHTQKNFNPNNTADINKLVQHFVYDLNKEYPHLNKDIIEDYLLFNIVDTIENKYISKLL